jgi:XTP/dITP diphosphohydrolase
MLEFLLASGNAHKAEELNQLLDSNVLKIHAAPEKIEVVEDGQSYQENALKKAQGYYQIFQRPVVSDDSGLNVVALPDELGIHSARFGGEELGHQEKCDLLIKKLDGKSGDERKASFVCYLCFYFSPEEVFFFEGRMDGAVGYAARGDQGFGYDPIFIPAHREGEGSLAMIPDWKQENSHRAQACRHALTFFRNWNRQN